MNTEIEARPSQVHLTARESDVLRHIASGCTYKQVARHLDVSLNTVASHVRNAYRKLGVRSGAHAVMRATQLKLFGEF